MVNDWVYRVPTSERCKLQAPAFPNSMLLCSGAYGECDSGYNISSALQGCNTAEPALAQVLHGAPGGDLMQDHMYSEHSWAMHTSHPHTF